MHPLKGLRSNHNIIPKDFSLPETTDQFGFLSNSSCLSQILQSYEKMFDAIKEKRFCDVIFFDFSKAFDAIPYVNDNPNLSTFALSYILADDTKLVALLESDEDGYPLH